MTFIISLIVSRKRRISLLMIFGATPKLLLTLFVPLRRFRPWSRMFRRPLSLLLLLLLLLLLFLLVHLLVPLTLPLPPSSLLHPQFPPLTPLLPSQFPPLILLLLLSLFPPNLLLTALSLLSLRLLLLLPLLRLKLSLNALSFRPPLSRLRLLRKLITSVLCRRNFLRRLI